jgi:hypothetical protein
MISRDWKLTTSVKNRLSSESGISFTEFSYQLLQAYDFHHLHSEKGCTIQIGGSDQWGNIVAGIDLIKSLNKGVSTSPSQAGQVKEDEGKDVQAYGMTIPLLTTSNGEKFGKSAGNAVWLDEGRTGISDFYQVSLKRPSGRSSALELRVQHISASDYDDSLCILCILRPRGNALIPSSSSDQQMKMSANTYDYSPYSPWNV